MHIDRTPPPAPPIAPAVARPAPAAPRSAAADGATPAPSLWDVLTPDERAFFEQLAALGPLAYGPAGGRETGPAAPLGQRLDVRG